MGQLEDMQVFIRVVEADGIGRAADQLGIAKSAVSRRLSELERRLGTRLINRTTRSSSLTEAGHSYYQQAVKVVDQVAELNSELQNAECALSGTIRVAVPLSFGLLHLGPAIDLFMKQHPQLSIHMDFSDRHVNIIEEGFDLALRIAELEDSTLQARKVCPCRLVLVASPDYLQQMGVPQTPQDLEQHRFVRYSGRRSQWVIADAHGKHHSFVPTGNIVANNGDFCLQMACAGHGFAMLPTFIAWQALTSGELVKLLPDYSIPDVSAWLVYPRNRYLALRVRRLIDFLVDRFGDQPYWDQAI